MEEKLNYNHIKELYEEEKAKVEEAKQKVINSCKMLKTARAETIKEFKCNLIKQIKYIEDAHQAEYKDDFGKGWMAGFSTATNLIRGAIDYIVGFENRDADNG